MAQAAQRQNRLLQALPEPERRRMVGEMQHVVVPVGEVIAQPGGPLASAYFPVTGVTSAIVVLEDGSTVEGATIGNEGMVGVSLLAGPVTNRFRFVAQVGGEMLRVRADRFGRIIEESQALADVLLRYAIVLIECGAQNAGCHRHHSVEQRMCRWLLETAERVGADSLPLTQEFLSEMLGVRRQSVNLVAGLLQRADLISYRRGQLTIVDRAGLEEASCECFRASQAIYEQAMRR